MRYVSLDKELDLELKDLLSNHDSYMDWEHIPFRVPNGALLREKLLKRLEWGSKTIGLWLRLGR